MDLFGSLCLGGSELSPNDKGETCTQKNKTYKLFSELLSQRLMRSLNKKHQNHPTKTPQYTNPLWFTLALHQDWIQGAYQHKPDIC